MSNVQDTTLSVSPLNYLFMHTRESNAFCLGVFTNYNSGTLLGGITFRDTLVQVSTSKKADSLNICNEQQGGLPRSCMCINAIPTIACPNFLCVCIPAVLTASRASSSIGSTVLYPRMSLPGLDLDFFSSISERRSTDDLPVTTHVSVRNGSAYSL